MSTVTKLPPKLEDVPDLEALNARLRDGAGRLDWSAVEVADIESLNALLAGLDLSQHGDALGLPTIPDQLSDAVLAALGLEPDFADWAGTASEEDGAGTDEQASAGQQVLEKPTPVQLRDELERLVVADLLGPAGGDEEEVLEHVLDR